MTEGERIDARGAREAGRGQNEAPDHGGTTGGFAFLGGTEWPHIENVSPVRPPGQAELEHLAKFSRKALHGFSTLPTVRHGA
ncbi:hypothetical protein GCM10010121_007680 [Streptomyces brasiliensis]|uniref:Uncharacterized protein n=1 Tax=Streptomyces brasiliensis TaxID=1954 RepID=A0A917NH14_9ACTN|nr:hypothetical protein GCM10010121_007680 [Streptomyces brasiliensis]